jgi:hypothetical protein
MPVKLERALKHQATKKGLKGEHKDAYVYGTLRKTGWKPSREKKMNDNSAVIRLQKISSDLDKVINFNDDDDDLLKKTAKVGVGAGALGAGGLYAAGLRQPLNILPKTAGGAIISRPGAQSLGQFGGYLKSDISNIGAGGLGSIGSTIGQGWSGSAVPALKKLLGIVPKALESKERLVRLSQYLDGAIQFAGNPKDPTAGMFGGTDPGILARTAADANQVSALQRIKLKINRLRAMGLHN